LVQNLSGHLAGADRSIQERQLQHIVKADRDYGMRVATALGLTL
jgi:catalase